MYWRRSRRLLSSLRWAFEEPEAWHFRRHSVAEHPHRGSGQRRQLNPLGSARRSGLPAYAQLALGGPGPHRREGASHICRRSLGGSRCRMAAFYWRRLDDLLRNCGARAGCLFAGPLAQRSLGTACRAHRRPLIHAGRPRRFCGSQAASHAHRTSGGDWQFSPVWFGHSRGSDQAALAKNRSPCSFQVKRPSRGRGESRLVGPAHLSFNRLMRNPIIAALGVPVFLDLKFHDIPNTVAKAVAATVRLDVQMLSVHISGGREMIKAAEQTAQESAWRLGHTPPLVLGVTVLTSLDTNALSELGFDPNVSRQVRRLANMANKAGLRGLVCSPLELVELRQTMPASMQLVTPGIRVDTEPRDDQKRKLT